MSSISDARHNGRVRFHSTRVFYCDRIANYSKPTEYTSNFKGEACKLDVRKRNH